MQVGLLSVNCVGTGGPLETNEGLLLLNTTTSVPRDTRIRWAVTVPSGPIAWI